MQIQAIGARAPQPDLRRWGNEMTTEMAEVLAVVSAIGFVVTTLFFWVRGVAKSSRSDLLAGILLLIVSCVALMATATSCEVFNAIGLVLIVFGIVSLMLAVRDCVQAQRKLHLKWAS